VTLLVVGASGLLGGNVVAAARQRGERVCGTYLTNDPTEGSSASGDGTGTFVDEGVETVRFDVTGGTGTDLPSLLDGVDRVVDCAAATDVDACETDPERARAVNAAWPGRLAAACAAREIPLCYVSTDYVFDGRDPPYAEGDDPNPLQVYGETKLAGERAVRDAGGEGPEPLVLRVSFLWGVDRTTGTLAGFPAWVTSELRAGETLRLFDDQRVTPTRAGDAARVALDLLEASAGGTYHVAARDTVTPFEFGGRVADRLGADATGRIERSSMADLDRPAPRPPETSLDVSKLEGELGREAPTLGEDLDAVKRAGLL
jgi:dTDP-4-dehydrorhamnose reductase